ncbi:MAG: NADH:flavin oxidoreductase/NADH oxidase [Pseudomonadota bacterium]|nr:NADH:flavin oxidoreductase/NADH oxidase [Pseudomonadota bacterium]
MADPKLFPKLFTELALRDLTLPNRIAVPPMLQYVAENGFPVDWHLMQYGRFAAGGAGLVFVESTKVERRGAGTLGDLFLTEDRYIEPLSRLAAIIKANGARAGIQLGHSGRKARARRPWEGREPLTPSPDIPDWEAWQPVGPSALSYGPGWAPARALDRAEIPDAIDAWGQAARRAHAAGFEALELHAAHGYLLHSFFSPEANRRTDDYGGSEANRMRFILEVVEAVRAHWPEGKPLFLRLSIEDEAGLGPAENIRLARAVRPLGVDVIDCSTGGTTAKVPNFHRLNQYGFQVPYAAQVRREAEIMTMAVGLIVHADQAEAILQAGSADLVAVGREFLNNPCWGMDAAQKLGVDPGFDQVAPQVGFWLGARAARGMGCPPSTWAPGLGEDAARAASGAETVEAGQ